MSIECHIKLIKSIWLEGPKFILPKRLSSPQIFYIICLVNEGNFPITHTMLLVFLKVSAIWWLFDGIPFYEILLGWLVIYENYIENYIENFQYYPSIALSMLAWKKIHTIPGTAVQVIGINAIFSLFKDLNI